MLFLGTLSIHAFRSGPKLQSAQSAFVYLRDCTPKIVYVV